MSSSRKNFNTGYKNVKDDFQHVVGKIFEKQYKGRDCNNSVFIKVLFCALRHVQSLFAVCRNLQNVPGDHAIAAAILKTLPEYTRLQKLINTTLAEQLPKKLFRKAYIFAFYGVASGRARWFFETYRKRYGIETSYRQMHECRIRTSTRKPELRLLYFALAMLMRNCWIWFERTFVMNNGRRSRQERKTYFSFKDLLDRLRKILEKELGSSGDFETKLGTII